MIRSGRMRSAFPDSSRIRTLRPGPRCSAAELERDHVLLLELELGGVLDRDDPLVARDEGETAFSVVVLPVPVPPEMRTLSFPRTQAARN